MGSPPDDRTGRVASGSENGAGLLQLECLRDSSKQAPSDERPAEILPPRATIDWLGRKQMKSKIAGGKNSRLDPSHRAYEHRFDSRSAYAESIRNCQRGHEVPTSAASGDQDTARPWGSGAAGQCSGRKVNHSRARLTALLSVALRSFAPAFLPPHCPAAPPTPSGVPSDLLHEDFLGDVRC